MRDQCEQMKARGVSACFLVLSLALCACAAKTCLCHLQTASRAALIAVVQ